MAKKIFLILVAMGMLVLLFGYFLLGGGGDDTVKESDPLPPVKVNNEPQTIVGMATLQELLDREENLECSITNMVASGSPISGTYFVSNNRSRGDFLTPEGLLTSVIVKEGKIYVWSEIEGEKHGIKSSLEETDSADENTLQFNEPITRSEAVKYNCKSWENVDGSIFEPPTDLIFKDFDDIKNSTMEDGTIFENPEEGIVLPE